jgi:hypothetical protein
MELFKYMKGVARVARCSRQQSGILADVKCVAWKAECHFCHLRDSSVQRGETGPVQLFSPRWQLSQHNCKDYMDSPL